MNNEKMEDSETMDSVAQENFNLHVYELKSHTISYRYISVALP